LCLININYIRLSLFHYIIRTKWTVVAPVATELECWMG